MLQARTYISAALIAGATFLAGAAALAASDPPTPDPPVPVSPLAQMRNGRSSSGNNQILTTGIRSPRLPSNHALIITVSEYTRGSLPGVLTDRKLGIELAARFGVPPQNIVELSERQVTRDGLKQALTAMNQTLLPGDKLFIYYSGHGARLFSPATKQCEESIVMQDMHLVTKTEFAALIKPLSSKADKTIVMLDSCHSGGVAQSTATRGIGAEVRRPKFSTEASSPQCSLAVNLGTFSQSRGIDLATTDNNLVVLAAARKNEVAWDTSNGGALTYNFAQCLGGAAKDSDHSGSISMDELSSCVQERLDKTQEESARQHVTLAGNGALVPGFAAHDGAAPAAAGSAPDGAPTAAAPPSDTAAAPAPAADAAPGPVDTMATLRDIYAARDDRWQVELGLDQPKLKIGTNLGMTVRSDHDGFVYIFYRGSQPDSLYLLFPNQLDSANSISANEDLPLPRKDWTVTALGPAGTDTLLVLVTETPRDFSALALPAEYVSQAGPFDKIRPTPQAAARIAEIASMSAAVTRGECGAARTARDLGVARSCSSTFGARMVSVDEVP